MKIQDIKGNRLAASELQKKTVDEIQHIELLLSRLVKTYQRYGVNVSLEIEAYKGEKGEITRQIRACDGDEELLVVVSSTYEDAIKSCQMHATRRAEKLESLDECLNPDEAPCGDCIWCDSNKDSAMPRVNMSGVELIAEERNRQIKGERWSAEHDAGHTFKEIANAALTYLGEYCGVETDVWPWESYWWKSEDDIRNLVKAGALIAAEIDRLQSIESEQKHE